MKQRSLKEWFWHAFWGSAVRLPIGVLLVIYLLSSINHGAVLSLSSYLAILKTYFGDRRVWVDWAVMWPLLLFVHTFYPYFRERKPSYIKKMKAQEEEFAATAKTDSISSKSASRDSDDRL